VEIQAPPPIPGRPTSSLVAVLLPFAFTLVGLGLSVAFLTGSNYSFLLLSLPLMFGSALVGVINYFNERKKYNQTLEQRQRLYRDHLHERRQALEESAAQQRRARLEIHPDPRTCFAIAARHSPDLARHLWERSGGLERPRDPDFLELRLGLGRLPASFAVKPPARPAQIGEKDDLFEQALRLADEFRFVDDLPIPLPLGEVGAAGVAGPRSLVLENVRAALVQLAALHAPNEVKLVALLPAHELPEWTWLRWLPHVWDDERKRRFLTASPEDARALLSALFPLLQKRALAQSGTDQPRLEHPAFVFLFADPSLYAAGAETSVIGPLMRLLLTQSKAANAYALFLNDRPEALPAACGAVLDLNASRLRLVGPPTLDLPLAPDRLSAAEAERFARALAPVRLKALTSAADLPASLPLTALLKTPRLEAYPLQQAWTQRDTFQRLEVPLGVEAGGGEVLLNFQDTASGGDGSHAMIGGTTGTGKTRFLQTLILLLAAHHHPHDVNFILIDYKGQDLLKGLEDLPHVVGTLGNLEKADTQALMIDRLFVCLEAELRRRRVLLAGRNINQYQHDHLQGKDPQPLPHLFVVIDEFAEMLRNSPDKATMTKRLLSIGATGRSLGVHLVLATQDPSGVVTDELRNNINIRICLRMGSRQASMDILRLPDAYENISSSQVGRAYLQVGNNDRFVLFQVAWGGDSYQPGQSSAASGLIARVELDGTRTPLRRFLPIAPGAAAETQLTALARHLQQTAADLGLTRLPGPLSPPLRNEIYLDEIGPATPPSGLPAAWSAAHTPYLAPIVGQLDDPSAQSQPPLALPLGDAGHLALFGESGSGKTTFLLTLLTSLALTYPPDRVQVYLLEPTGRRLEWLKGFPHVGDHFSGDDLERLKRYFRFLERELRQRKEAFARLGITSLRDLHGSPLPAGEGPGVRAAILTLLEDYAAFYKLTQDRNLDLNDRLVTLVREGAAYGLHFVLTLTAPSELRVNLANSISLAATLHLANPADYSLAVGPTGGLTPAPVPGRGLFKGAPPLEFQTALPVRGRSDPERIQALKALMENLDRAWGDRPRPRAFAPLPAVLPLEQIASPLDRWPDSPSPGLSAAFALSLEDPDQPFRVDLRQGPYFLISGAPASGKSALLQSWLLALANLYPPSRLLFYLVDYRRITLFPFGDLPHVTAPLQPLKGRKATPRRGYLTDESALAQALSEIEVEMTRRQAELEQARQKARAAFDPRAWLDARPTLLLAIDDFDLFESETQSGTKEILNQNLKKWRDLGFALIVAGPLSEMENAWGWIKHLRDNPFGFQLGTAAYNQVFKRNDLPADNPARQLPPGQGFYIGRGQFHPIQAAIPLHIAAWIEKIAQRPRA
jgi:S-DNA-T family DNA segregation ATPase FtsK/SpoIIIE